MTDEMRRTTGLPTHADALLNGGHDPVGLYHPSYEKDSCGFGLIASLDDAPSHWIVQTAIASLNRLTHRGAIAADGKTGDGCGLLLKKPAKFLRAVGEDGKGRADAARYGGDAT